MICDDRAHRSELPIIKKGLGAGDASEMRAGSAVVPQTTEPISCLLWLSTQSRAPPALVIAWAL